MRYPYAGAEKLYDDIVDGVTERAVMHREEFGMLTTSSWNAPPRNAADRLHIVWSNLFHTTLVTIDPSYRALLDRTENGKPLALILSDGRNRSAIYRTELTEHLLVIRGPNDACRSLILNDGGRRIISSLADLCVEFFCDENSQSAGRSEN